MAYVKTVYVNDNPPALDADNLNKMENGIADAHEEISTLDSGLHNEISDLKNDLIPVIQPIQSTGSIYAILNESGTVYESTSRATKLFYAPVTKSGIYVLKRPNDGVQYRSFGLAYFENVPAFGDTAKLLSFDMTKYELSLNVNYETGYIAWFYLTVTNESFFSICEYPQNDLTADELNQINDSMDTINDNLNTISDLTITEDYDVKRFTQIPQKLINGSGTITNISIQKYGITDYIPVIVGDTYVITGSADYNNCILAWYNSEYQLVDKYNPGSTGSTIKSITDKEFVAPTNAAYLVVAYIMPTIPSVKQPIGYVNILEGRVEKLEEEIPEKVPIVSLNKNGNDLTITDISSGNYLMASLNGSNNGGFNFSGYYNSSASLIKTATDDICPIFYDGSYRCGNHGNNVARKATVTGHGLTESDIGKVFTSASNVNYVLVRIIDADTLWFVNDSSTHSFVTGAISSPLTNGSTSLTVSSSELVQLIPSINNRSCFLLIDDNVITDSDIYNGECVTISEQYQSVDTLAMLSFLKDNVGNNTNSSYYDDEIAGDLIYSTNYIIKDNLQIVVESKIITLRDEINLTRWGITQSQVMKTGRRIMIPYTTFDDVTTISESVVCDSSIWDDTNFPPFKIYQFDTNSNAGIGITYRIDFGDAEANIRKNLCDESAITVASTYKLYPFVIMKNENIVSAYSEYKGVAVRQLLDLSDTLKIVYESNSILYVEVEKRTDSVERINIPEGYNNSDIIGICHNGTARSVSTSVINNEIIVCGKGSLSIKINKA